MDMTSTSTGRVPRDGLGVQNTLSCTRSRCSQRRRRPRLTPMHAACFRAELLGQHALCASGYVYSRRRDCGHSPAYEEAKSPE